MVTARAFVDTDGRIRLPDEVREAAHLEPGQELSVTFAFGVITVSPEEDDWEVGDGFLAGIEEALEDARQGRIVRHESDEAFEEALRQTPPQHS